MAHLDVRLENICFKLPDNVVIVDYDRYMDADDCGDLSSYDSVMYRYRESGMSVMWTWDRFDWRQLGILIAWIIVGHNDYHHKEVVVPNNDEFLQDLLCEGQFFFLGL